jgi:two-component system response regulator (stage 0 sporulation protein F)
MKRIMIVEDEDALRDIYVMLFKMNKFEVYEAANGKVALEQMDAAKPHAIILDALMPVMGGISFLRAVKIRENYKDTKVLMLSNLSDATTITLSQKLGAQKYLLKASVTPGELVKTIKDLLDE